MKRGSRPHLLGIDDGPFDKRSDRVVPIVGVMMEVPDLVEAVAISEFPVDGSDVADFLADWIAGLRLVSALHGIVLGGVTIAGLAVVDVDRLSRRLGLPVLVVTRRQTADERLKGALRAAGLEERIALVERHPPALRVAPGLFVSHAGAAADLARTLAISACRKSRLPEPLRVAHLIGSALGRGESRGRP